MFFKNLFFNKKVRKNNLNPANLLTNKRPQNLIWQSFLKNKIINSFLVPIFLGILFSFLWVSNATAHFPDQSYLYFQIYDQDIEARVEITVSDLNKALNLDLPTNKKAKVKDIKPHLEKIKEYINKKFTVTIDNQEYPLQYKNKYDTFKTGFAQFFTFNYKIKNLQELPQQLKVYFGVLLDIKPNHKNLVVIEHNWKTGTFANEAGVSLILTPDSQEQILYLSPSSSSVFTGFLAIIRLGIVSFLKSIYHVFFLIALLLPSVLQRENLSWQPVKNFRLGLIYALKIFIAFTLGYTITLVLASLQIVAIPSPIVMSLIAISIAIAAFDIIYPILRKRIWWIIFGFGLFHGFGFANELIKLQVVKEYPFLSLLGYSLGIDLGQIIIILVVFPILYLLSKQKFYTKGILKLGAIFLMAIGIILFVETAFNLNFGLEMAIKQFIKSILFRQ